MVQVPALPLASYDAFESSHLRSVPDILFVACRADDDSLWDGVG